MAVPDHYEHSHFTTTPLYLPEQPLSVSPKSETLSHGMNSSTISLLDALVAFYHQERIWVGRTRASLEQGPLFDEQQHACDPEGEAQDTVVIKEEPSDGCTTPNLAAGRAQPSARELWRTNESHKSRAARPPRSVRGAERVVEVEDDSVRILHMFQCMVEARMESCQRVNRLVRNAHNNELYVR